MLAAPWRGRARGQRLITGMAPERAEDLRTMLAQAAARRLRGLVDSRFPLQQAAQAHARAETAGRLGSVVLVMDEGGHGPAAGA